MQMPVGALVGSMMTTHISLKRDDDLKIMLNRITLRPSGGGSFVAP